jgi:hypothetical protein
VAHGRYLAAHIPDATFVEVPGVDYGLGIGEVDAILDPIEEFLTGARAGAVSNRSLATLLFADVVASTERLSATGAGASCSSCRTGSCVGSSHGTAARS